MSLSATLYHVTVLYSFITARSEWKTRSRKVWVSLTIARGGCGRSNLYVWVDRTYVPSSRWALLGS